VQALSVAGDFAEHLREVYQKCFATEFTVKILLISYFNSFLLMNKYSSFFYVQAPAFWMTTDI